MLASLPLFGSRATSTESRADDRFGPVGCPIAVTSAPQALR
jgi:hypothetical protein